MIAFRQARALSHKSIVTTERYSHLGSNGMAIHSSEIAEAVTAGFVISGVMQTVPPQAPNMNIPRKSVENFVTTPVTSDFSEARLNKG